jgi:hypothetical protein
MGREFFEERLQYENQIVIIDKIHVHQKYRGVGYGKIAMKSILNYFYDRMVFIYPHPLLDTCPEHLVPEGIEKLRKYWMTCGFKQINDGSAYVHTEY